MESLKGLDLVNNTSTPLPADVENYLLTTFANGSGPDGTFLLTDFIGSATGITANPALSQASTFISNNTSALSDLSTLYSQMVEVVDGNYGTPPAINIPTGPAAGSYTTYDEALDALVVACNDEIGNILNAVDTNDVSTVNSSWFAMAKQWANESVNHAKAGLDVSVINGNAQLPITAFMTGLNGYGTDVTEGMSAHVLESVANVSNQYGQAIIAAMREGRNNQSMDIAGVGRDNISPDTPSGNAQSATLSDSSYSVNEARNLFSN